MHDYMISQIVVIWILSLYLEQKTINYWSFLIDAYDRRSEEQFQSSTAGCRTFAWVGLRSPLWAYRAPHRIWPKSQPEWCADNGHNAKLIWIKLNWAVIYLTDDHQMEDIVIEALTNGPDGGRHWKERTVSHHRYYSHHFEGFLQLNVISVIGLNLINRYHPGAIDAFGWSLVRPFVTITQFYGIGTDFHKIIDESDNRRQRIDG